MAGNNSATSVRFTDVTDPVMLKRDLSRLVEYVDTAFGNRGVQTPTATVEDLKISNSNSAVGVNRENAVNTLLDRIKALELKVTALENA